MDRSDLEQWKPKEVARLLALVETERRYYQEIVAGLPVGLLVLSSDLSIISANAAVRRIFRLRSGEALRGGLEALFSGDVLDKVREALEKGTAQGITAASRPEHGSVPLRISIQLIRSWESEDDREALLTIEDIGGLTTAEPKEIEIETETEPAAAAEPVAGTGIPEPRAAELLHNLDAIVWAASLPDMQFLFVNESALRMLGYPAEQWATPGFAAFRLHPADRERILREYAEAMERGDAVTCEFRAVDARGHAVWLRETVRPLRDAEGRPRHAVGLAVEISRRRREEEQRVQAGRMDALAKLSSRLAHDMNNLLMIVNGYTEEILDNLPADSTVRADLTEVRRAGERLSGIADRLLALTRRKADEPGPVDAAALLSEAKETLAAGLGSDIALMVKAPEDESVYVVAARGQLTAVIRAFVLRAAEAMDGPGEITLTAAASGDRAAIRIHDSGPALTADALHALFESVLALKEGGDQTAQAVSLSWSIVEQWNGSIDVESESGSGNTVMIELPRAEAPLRPPELPAEQPAEAPAPAPEPEPETILVVEDETGIRALVRKILERQGYRVLDASRAEDAIRICTEHQGAIHLVITDVMMPEMGGRDMVERLLPLRPDLKVLYVSGYTDDPGIYAAVLPPGSAFLQKPFTLGSLLDKVREVLG